MVRSITAVVLLAALTWGSDARGQNPDEVKRLKDQVELLQAKLEAATLKIEKLERELAAARGGAKTGGDEGKPTYVMKTPGAKTGGEREVKFVVDKLTRQGQTFTFDTTATLLKGELRRPVEFGFFVGIDQDGGRHEGRINVGRAKGLYGVAVSPTFDIPAKFSMTVELPESVKSLKKLQLGQGTLKNFTPVIEFNDLALPRAKE